MSLATWDMARKVSFWGLIHHLNRCWLIVHCVAPKRCGPESRLCFKCSFRYRVWSWSKHRSSTSKLHWCISSPLIAEPSLTRPGYGKANPKDQRSISYNKNITLQTTRWAIVEWLKDEHKDGIWAVSLSVLWLVGTRMKSSILGCHSFPLHPSTWQDS